MVELMIPINKIQLHKLQQLNPSDIQRFLEQLSNNGFAIVTTDEFVERKAIAQTLQAARKMKTFRFPPHESIGVYSQPQRDSFSTMFRWSRICLKALLTVLDPSKQCKELWKALVRCENNTTLFHPNGVGNEPFLPGMDFSGSFFNVFHYDFGLLNAHRDRCLVTVIAVDQITEPVSKTALWAHCPTDTWVNIDELVNPQDIIIFVGEDFAELSTSLGHEIPAVLHCTRVNPNSERLIYFNDKPDPQSNPDNNRVSVAFVLSDAIM
jgi:hypothetical protein